MTERVQDPPPMRTARHHRLYLSLWSDPVFLAQDNDTRNVWRYVLVGPDRQTEGLYHLDLARAADLLLIDTDAITHALATLAGLGVIVWDQALSHVLIPQAMKYQHTRNPNGAKAAATKVQQLNNQRLTKVLRGCAERFGDLRMVFALDSMKPKEEAKPGEPSWLSGLLEDAGFVGNKPIPEQQINQRSTNDQPEVNQ